MTEWASEWAHVSDIRSKQGKNKAQHSSQEALKYKFIVIREEISHGSE